MEVKGKMEQYKKEFIEFMVDSSVLKFGEFTLKSGRRSPFFMNAGGYVTGTQLRRLGEYYAKAIHDNYGLDFDVLFGPAYKGIPLSVATTMAISGLYGKEVRYCSNRKEVKDHGDTGILLGSKLKDGDKVVIIEDVTTSGKSIEETFPILRQQADVEIKGLMVSLNRMERGLDSEKSALHEIKEKYGPDAIMLTGSSRGPGNEANFVMQKFTRACIGTNNIDNCARTCHGPSVIGLMDTVGSGAMSVSIPNLENADLIMLFGYNPSASHPIVARRIVKAKEKGAKIIVVDPRSIETARIADLYIQIKNGCNLAFMNAFANVIVSENMHDKAFIDAHTNGFDAWWETIKNYTPESVAEVCGCDPDDIRKAARMYATAPNSVIGWGMGVTQQRQGVKVVHTIAAIACVANQIGRDNAGLAPVRGQNNVQGACDMGATPADFPGYQKVANAGVRAKFENAWGVSLPEAPGLMATECFGAMKDGRIRGLFIFGEDPVRTDADTNHVMGALRALDFLVVDDLFLTETAALADVVLPGRSYAEKEGTFTNTERRVQRIRPAVEIEGTRPDTWIFTEIMNRMGYAQPHLSPAAIMDEVARPTPSYGGISHERLDGAEVAGRGLQWPCPTPDAPGTPIMHVGGFTRGRGKFSDAEYRASDELPCEEFPLVLMTGRVLHHYNACAMTSRTEGLNAIGDSSFIELNDADAAALGVADGDAVRVASRRGEITTTARVSAKT